MQLILFLSDIYSPGAGPLHFYVYLTIVLGEVDVMQSLK